MTHLEAVFVVTIVPYLPSFEDVITLKLVNKKYLEATNMVRICAQYFTKRISRNEFETDEMYKLREKCNKNLPENIFEILPSAETLCVNNLELRGKKEILDRFKLFRFNKYTFEDQPFAEDLRDRIAVLHVDINRACNLSLFTALRRVTIYNFQWAIPIESIFPNKSQRLDFVRIETKFVNTFHPKLKEYHYFDKKVIEIFNATIVNKDILNDMKMYAEVCFTSSESGVKGKETVTKFTNNVDDKSNEIYIPNNNSAVVVEEETTTPIDLSQRNFNFAESVKSINRLKLDNLDFLKTVKCPEIVGKLPHSVEHLACFNFDRNSIPWNNNLTSLEVESNNTFSSLQFDVLNKLQKLKLKSTNVGNLEFCSAVSLAMIGCSLSNVFKFPRKLMNLKVDTKTLQDLPTLSQCQSSLSSLEIEGSLPTNFDLKKECANLKVLSCSELPKNLPDSLIALQIKQQPQNFDLDISQLKHLEKVYISQRLLNSCVLPKSVKELTLDVSTNVVKDYKQLKLEKLHIICISNLEEWAHPSLKHLVVGNSSHSCFPNTMNQLFPSVRDWNQYDDEL
ncbi:hypothetical protein EIN_083310 [Entamoeba invadens IP1]|uniref:hypothetical protein n=1 Tax=Entamoeba invadens IP1 TaxID=370355 RepID=UPI0002C3DCBB|nr:hypothetical protein EIN_083310 [Entamoeba invadens IP1]ELP85209.1 hypothetical protein EIN_083310 [Entamoeba invadens IP1]|eukprot:XP_004184555.1 hypothetical protein EIN_083310 [Entamoeba invadens IP1]